MWHPLSPYRLRSLKCHHCFAFPSLSERKAHSHPHLLSDILNSLLAGSDGSPDGHFLPPVGALRAQGGCGEGLGVLGRSSRRWPQVGHHLAGTAHQEGEHVVAGHSRPGVDGIRSRRDPGVAGRQEDPPHGHRHHHGSVVWPRPCHSEGPFGVRQVARHHGVPRLPQDRARRQGGRHAQGQLHHRPPRPGLPRERPPVRQQRAPARHAHRRRGLQRRRVPAHRQGAVLHRRRLRDECRRQPPRPLPTRPRAPRGPQGLRLPIQAPHHCRLHHREHEHAGRQRAAEGEPWGPEGPGVRAERCGQRRHDRRCGVRWRQGLQRQQGVQHADDAGVSPAVSRGDRDNVRVALPRMHCHHGVVPGAHPPVPPPLPAVPEVHHQGVRVRGGGRQEAGAGGERAQPHQVRRLLELEQQLGVLREPALRGSQRHREGKEGLGAQREARRTRMIAVMLSRISIDRDPHEVTNFCASLSQPPKKGKQSNCRARFGAPNLVRSDHN